MNEDKVNEIVSEAMAKLQQANAEEVRRIIREELAHFMMQSKFVFQRPVQIMDGNDVILPTAIGTKIGTATTQKLGFFGKSPVVQQANPRQPNNQGAAYNQTDAQTLTTSINDIRQALTALGLTA